MSLSIVWRPCTAELNTRTRCGLRYLGLDERHTSGHRKRHRRCVRTRREEGP